MKTKTQKIVMASMLASLVCVATMIIKVPSPLKGYMNLGDSVVLLSGWILSPCYGFMASAVGSALADVFSGYAMYAPATFLIKGLMAIIAGVMYKKAKNPTLVSIIISGAVAELFMVLGYFVFEGFLYGFITALMNTLTNLVQGIFGLSIGVVLKKVFEKNNILN